MAYGPLMILKGRRTAPPCREKREDAMLPRGLWRPLLRYTSAGHSRRAHGYYFSSTTESTTTSNNDVDGSFPLVSWTVNEATKIGVITLESPKTYNALTVEMGHDFESLIRRIQKELTTDYSANVNAIVLQGSGDRAFSAGGNVSWLKSLKEKPVEVNADSMMNFYSSFLCIRQVPVPVVAAIQGPAVGAGACLAMACDLRVMSPSSQLGFTFSKLGIHSGLGGSHLLMRALGSAAKANEILLTGKTLIGTEAYQLGLINRLAEDGQVKKEAHRLAEEVGKQNPLAIRSMIQTLRQQQDEGLNAALHREAYAQALCYSRKDWGEGLDAALEKREPFFDDYIEHKK